MRRKVFTLMLLGARVANADPPSGESGGASQAGASGGGGAPAGAAIAPGGNVYVTPQAAPKGPVGGGNVTSSSSTPRVGDERDGFDLSPKAGGGQVARGASDGPIFSGEPRTFGVPRLHTVKRGDTLSGICDHYFQNPYLWTKIWTYNAQIQNPHWIYPGDQIRLRSSNEPAEEGASRASLIDRRAKVAPNTVFLRDQGFIEDSSDENWGVVSGSPEEKMFLTHTDEIYSKVDEGHDVREGQELTVFRLVRKVPGGNAIQIQGTMRVDRWDAKERIARGAIVEALDVIERGARVGPVGRRFEVVPPVRNERSIEGRVVASVHPHNFYGQNQVVFLDRGSNDLVKSGNRFLIIRKGDAWRKSLATPGAGYRISPEAQDLPDMEKPPAGHDSSYPEEVVGELRVISVRPRSSTCLVTSSRVEIETGDRAFARRGY